MPDQTEQERLAAARAEMNEAAVIEAGTKEIGKDPFMDVYGTVKERLGPAAMNAFNDAALAHDNIGKIYTGYAHDPARLDRVAKLPYGRAVVDIGRVEQGISGQTAHEPLWATLAKGGPDRLLTDEEWATPGVADKLPEPIFQKNFEHQQRKRAARFPQRLGSRAR